MQKYRILVVTPTFAPDVNGLANVALKYCLGLISLGHTVEVATPAMENYSHHNIPVHGFDLRGSFTFKNPIRGQVFKYLKFLKNNSYDLIICHALQTAIVDLTFIASKTPLLYFSHGISWASTIMPGFTGLARVINYSPYRILGPWIIKKAKFAIFLGQNTINDRTFDSKFFPEESKMVIPNASDFSETSVKIYPNSRKLNVLTVGLCSPEKGFDRILTILPHLKSENIGVFRICTFEGSAYLKHFMNEVGRMNLQFLVEFIFDKSARDLEPFYEDADLLLNLSHSECYPLIVADAQNKRLPTLCFDTGYQREIPGIYLVQKIAEVVDFINIFPENAKVLESLSERTIPRKWHEATIKLEKAVHLSLLN